MKSTSVLATAIVLVSCGRTSTEPRGNEKPIGKPVSIQAPLGLPPVPVPADNPLTAETIALGRKLFYDPKVSGDKTISCASCHNPLFAFSDRRKLSVGVQQKTGVRNAPTVLNAAYFTAQFWDGRAASLEEQAAGPIANPIEMNHKPDVFASTLNADPAYVAEFAKAFGPGTITMPKIQKALAAFERTVLSGNSPFDRYQFGGDKTAMSRAAIRGLALFTDSGKGNCASCHTIGPKWALFSDGKFHNLGIGMNAEGELTDLGRFHHTSIENEKGAFRTPSLRNVAQTAPYMHDGSLKTLRDVIDFYVGGGNSNPHLDKMIGPLDLTRAERDDLIAFLESLTGELPPDVGPPS